MFEIPEDRLPPGLTERLDRPPAEPPVPKPAATVVLMRDTVAGPEVLLLCRSPGAGFMPGTYVFPGGRVDASDRDPKLLSRAVGLVEARVPEPAFRLAAVREAFEETGILLATNGAGPVPDAATSRELAVWREALMQRQAELADLAEALDLHLPLAELVYCAHWITPVFEPRRFDTRFFLAEVDAGRQAVPDSREMTDAAWLTPAAALDRFRAGRLALVFPTVRTIEALLPYRSAAEALDAFRGRDVAAILPRMVRTARGVAVELERSE